MRRRQLLGRVGGVGTAVVAGCAAPFRPSGTVLAAVHGSNTTNEDYTVEVTVELDGERVGEGTLALARHRTGEGSPSDELDCTWPTTERGTFRIAARLVERDETHERSTDDEHAPDDTCQNARILVEDDALTVSLWGCDSRDVAPPGYDCADGEFDWD